MTYNKFKQDIKNIIIRVHGRGVIESVLAKRVIDDISLRCADVDNNDDYFRPLFEDGKTPIEAIESLRYNEDELFRTIDSFSDQMLINEIENRRLTDQIISDADTDDLEYEINNRWDKTLVNPSQIDRDDLLDMLGIKESDICKSEKVRDAICQVLGFSNSFAYTNEDIINELKRVL